MIKAVLFDMDGVLIDAREWHYEALNKALMLFGYEISRDEHLSTFDGLPTKEKLKILTKSRGLPVLLHPLINDMKQSYTNALTYEKCRPTFNHRYALSKLRQDGYKIAVCSNSIRQTVDTMMNLSGLAPYLDLILSNNDVSMPKPSPEIYTRAMQHFHVDPHETLILEDNEHGINAARASGASVMIIRDPSDVSYASIINKIAHINEEDRDADNYTNR